jgi:hypothetical protein
MNEIDATMILGAVIGLVLLIAAFSAIRLLGVARELLLEARYIRATLHAIANPPEIESVE